MTFSQRLRRARAQARRVQMRREADPQWWADYLARNAAYRRERAASDPEYRHLRNSQAK